MMVIDRHYAACNRFYEGGEMIDNFDTGLRILTDAMGLLEPPDSTSGKWEYGQFTRMAGQPNVMVASVWFQINVPKAGMMVSHTVVFDFTRLRKMSDDEITEALGHRVAEAIVRIRDLIRDAHVER